MTTIFPIGQPLLPHNPPLTGIFERRRELDAILSDIRKGNFVALWAPRYAGRTTFLHSLQAALSRSEGEAAVYVSPEDLRDSSTRASLFQSLSSHIQTTLAPSVGDQEEPNPSDWDRPDALELFLRRFLETRSLRRLTILLDDCDKLISTSLVTLLRSLRDISGHYGGARDPQRRLGFVVAGAVSFRNFKLLEPDELSPFDDWSITHLYDLTEQEARQYLESAFSAIDVEAETEAIDKLVEYAGGDLLRLNTLTGNALVPGNKTLTTVDVSRAVHRLLHDYQSDTSIRYMLSVISHDPRCLDVVERMKRGKADFERSHLNRYQDQYFGISNQELSGGFLLIREGEKPVHWQVRNGFCREVFANYFSTQQLVRAFLDLGRYDKIGHHIEQLASELSDDFREDVLRFDESALRDVIDWFWSRSFKGDRISIGLEAFEFVLERIFGVDEFAVYEADQDRSKLLRNEFLPSRHPLSVVGVSEIDLRSSAPPSREVRVFHSELYSAEIEKGTHLKIVIPLRDYNEKASGVLSFQAKRHTEPWATLFVRIPIIERAVNLIWPRFSRYESDQHLVLQNLAKGVSASTEAEAPPARGIPILIATKFETELYHHFQRNLARFPSSFEPRLLEFHEGFILERILEAIQAPDSFLIFDLSNINANVLFELGLAIGLNRPGFPAYEERYRAEPEILKGLLFATYRTRRPLGEDFFSRLQERWSSYLGHRDEPDFVHLLNCRVPDRQTDRRYVLVIDHNHFHDLSNFRKAVQAAAKKADLEVVYLWNSDDHLEAWGEEHMILTRSFRLIKEATAVVARVEKIEVDRSCASRFVATGIAEGLKVTRQGCRNLSLIARTSRLGGEPIVPPSDLDGVGPMPFDGKSKGLSDSLEKAFTQVVHGDRERGVQKRGKRSVRRADS